MIDLFPGQFHLQVYDHLQHANMV